MAEEMEHMANKPLRKDGHNELMLEELIAGRLYTGPCYSKYNSVLRMKSGNKHLIDVFGKLCKGNMYATTIHAINSCVIKLSKLAKAVKVYRGLAGGVLPTEFWRPNEHGVKGGIEYGFSSTTTDRSKAVHFATAGGMADGESTCSTIFEMQADNWQRCTNTNAPIPIHQYPCTNTNAPLLMHQRRRAHTDAPLPTSPPSECRWAWSTAALTSAGSASTHTSARFCYHR